MPHTSDHIYTLSINKLYEGLGRVGSEKMNGTRTICCPLQHSYRADNLGRTRTEYVSVAGYALAPRMPDIIVAERPNGVAQWPPKALAN